MENFRVITGEFGTVYAGNNYMQASCAFQRMVKEMLDRRLPYAIEGELRTRVKLIKVPNAKLIDKMQGYSD